MTARGKHYDNVFVTDLGKAESVSYNVSSAVESLARSQATSIVNSISRGVIYATQQLREPLRQSESENSVGERSGRRAEATTNSGQHERVATFSSESLFYSGRGHEKFRSA